MCLSGPSGAGKTRLLRAVADLDPHQGAVYLDGTACVALPPARWRRRVGLLPAESHWWEDRVGAHFPGTPVAGLEELGFGVEVLDWPVSRLSSGERQRLALLRLLALEPAVLLLDEPTANLDPANVQRMEALLADYRQRRQAALLWVTHDAAQAARMARRRLVLANGALQQDAVRTGEPVPAARS